MNLHRLQLYQQAQGAVCDKVTNQAATALSQLAGEQAACIAAAEFSEIIDKPEPAVRSN
jgi:hypothetical protein